jgi:hypothetical protein
VSDMYDVCLCLCECVCMQKNPFILAFFFFADFAAKSGRGPGVGGSFKVFSKGDVTLADDLLNGFRPVASQHIPT